MKSSVIHPRSDSRNWPRSSECNPPVRAHIDASNWLRQWYILVENGGKFYLMCSVHNRYVTRLVLKHRILVFKLDFKLDLLQMTLSFIYGFLQDSCARHIYELDPK